MSNAVWKFDDNTYEFIKGEVIHLFIKYQVKCIPVSGFEIATKMGIKLIPYSSLSPEKRKCAESVDPDGFVACAGTEECIYYNDVDHTYERQNMTILHEIAHIVLDHTGSPDNRDREEDEADFFAKYAIAPPVLVDRINPQSYKEIYDHFDITYEAAHYAYDYYLAWKSHHQKTKSYTQYEIALLKLYLDSIVATRGGDSVD